MSVYKILITGGAGFIGSAVIRHLINHTPHSVMNIDKLTYASNLASLKSIADNNRYQFKQIDICDAPAIRQSLDDYQPNIIMHLAAESHVDQSIASPMAFMQTNIMGTYHLLEETTRYWKTLSPEKQTTFRFHHISTDEVYGDLGGSSTALFTEQSHYAPSSPYSASKASSDHLVRAWHRTYQLPTLITNCSNNYGPYQYPEKLIPVAILNALNGKSIPIYGSGQQIRDWLYVDDHARALILVATQGQPGETYNIGSHTEKSNLDVVLLICEILQELVPQHQPYSHLIKYVLDRPGHDTRYAIDARKLKNELGWTPQVSFEQGMLQTVKWYVNQHKE